MTAGAHVVAYPGLMAHAVQVALALLEAGRLARFETTVAFGSDSNLLRWLESVGANRVAAHLGRRSLPLLPSDVVRRRPWAEMARLAVGRLGGPVAGDVAWEESVRSFDRGVAASLTPSLRAVDGFEHSCRLTFERAARLGVGRVFHMAAPHPRYSAAVIAREVARYPELRTPYARRLEKNAAGRWRRVDRELELASLVVANSAFTARSAAVEGVAPEKIRSLPLGAPEVDPSWRSEPAPRRPTVLYAGPVSIRKGAHLLLDAWRRLKPAGAELWLVGEWTLPESMRASLPDSVRSFGGVPRKRLFQMYKSASVLAFPTLCDGYGMVAAEALAHGLPVVTTRSAGAADLVRDGENGFLVPPGDAHALAGVLDRCLRRPADLAAMRPVAEAAAARWQWGDFRRGMTRLLDEYFAAEGR